ncbi:hypothetical protein [Candidatus Chloroploca asiatica]|nr:hypothetical protein [Candidatus Chloroploca asiatica]
MNKAIMWQTVLLSMVLAGLVIFGALSAEAQGNNFRIVWWSTAAGGASVSASEKYRLDGAVGNVSNEQAAGGIYQLSEDALPPPQASSDKHRLYLPLLTTSAPQ